MRVRPIVAQIAGLAAVCSACADDIAPLGDEFSASASIGAWEDLGEVEGWATPSYELADISDTEGDYLPTPAMPLGCPMKTRTIVVPAPEDRLVHFHRAAAEATAVVIELHLRVVG